MLPILDDPSPDRRWVCKERRTEDIPESPLTDLALANGPITDLANGPITDLVNRSVTDLGSLIVNNDIFKEGAIWWAPVKTCWRHRWESPLTDLANGPITDLANGPITDLANGPITDLANGSLTDLGF